MRDSYSGSTRPSSAKSPKGHLGGPATMLPALGGQDKIKNEVCIILYVWLCRSKNIDSDFYVGTADDLRNRVKEHKAGEVVTTRKFDEVDLVYYEACLNKTDARKKELQLKTGFGRGYLKRRLEGFLKEFDRRERD